MGDPCKCTGRIDFFDDLFCMSVIVGLMLLFLFVHRLIACGELQKW